MKVKRINTNSEEKDPVWNLILKTLCFRHLTSISLGGKNDYKPIPGKCPGRTLDHIKQSLFLTDHKFTEGNLRTQNTWSISLRNFTSLEGNKADIHETISQKREEANCSLYYESQNEEQEVKLDIIKHGKIVN